MLTVSEPVFESVGESIEISPSALSDNNLPAFSLTLFDKSEKDIEPLFVISGAEVQEAIVTARININKL
jgi:hypothetical protein